jgi:hypothetical protein
VPPRESALRRLEEPPLDDSLAAINWMQRALVAMACDVKNSKIAEAEKRAEMLKIADRMAKLRDPDRIYQAELALRERQQKRDKAKTGPEMTSATEFDAAAGSLGAIRGRPKRGGLS